MSTGRATGIRITGGELDRGGVVVIVVLMSDGDDLTIVLDPDMAAKMIVRLSGALQTAERINTPKVLS